MEIYIDETRMRECSEEDIRQASRLLDKEIERRRVEENNKAVREFKEAARKFFDHNINCYIYVDNEEVYLDSVDDFFFDL